MGGGADFRLHLFFFFSLFLLPRLYEYLSTNNIHPFSGFFLNYSYYLLLEDCSRKSKRRILMATASLETNYL